MHFSHNLFILAQAITSVLAAPATPPTQALRLNSFNTSIFSSDNAADLLSLTPLDSSNSNITADFYQWRIYQDGVPSSTSLRIALKERSPIPKVSLGRTILTTQVALRTYISGHYGAANDPLLATDDPYKSSSQLTGCFLGVDSFPKGNRHLTYGVVALVLQGLWDFLYKGGRYMGAVFEVQDDKWGTVGIGRVSREVPG